MWLPPQRAHACCPVTAHQGTSWPLTRSRGCVALDRLSAGQSLCTLEQFWGHPRDLPAASQLRDSAPTSLAVLALLAMALELLTPTSFLPPPQESSTVRQLSIDLFLETLNYVEDQEKRKMQEEVCRSLVLLYLHLHDEEESVAKVGIAFIWGRAMLLLWCPPDTKSIAAHGSVSRCCCILPVEGLWGPRALLLLLGCSAISALFGRPPRKPSLVPHGSCAGGGWSTWYRQHSSGRLASAWYAHSHTPRQGRDRPALTLRSSHSSWTRGGGGVQHRSTWARACSTYRARRSPCGGRP